jgi:hypothetical protein
MAFMLGITPWPVVSALLWITLFVSALYLARATAHKAVQATARAFHRSFRTASKAVARSEGNLAARNREVLLAAGREAKERVIEREFDRINDTVRKDLANYAELHRTLDESIGRIETDHQESINVPPDPPGWVKAVEAIAKIDEREGRFGIELLNGMRPNWRRIEKTLSRVGKNVDSLLARSVTIDRLMQEYEDIVRGHDRAMSVLSSSSLVNFFVSGLVLTVAIGGAAINFSLIARPMAEMVGGTNLIGGFRTADIAALVIIMVEISMGLFLMESLRITRLFPVIGALPDKTRIRMAWITFTILFLLATVEAGLAYMREVLLHDELATSALLRGDAAAATSSNEYLWITTAAQMGMGFILPFALTFVAIPLETFVHSLRTVLGLVGIAMLRAVSLVLRLMGNASLYLGALFEQLYDLPLFVPLWLEQRMSRDEGGKRSTVRGGV